MDRKDIVKISNEWFTKTLGIQKVREVIIEYCVEKGKTTQEASSIAETLITPQIFAIAGHKAFEFALEYYWKKFNVVLLSNKVNLNAYINSDFINKNYILAY